ncbi:MAG: sigma-70 family RNA polymerase sigma factor [Gemmatimonadota bacterium]|nr:MAG: sigma-70 family RNA polymerase sigma factor [Gemmatimonadota bacterium]
MYAIPNAIAETRANTFEIEALPHLDAVYRFATMLTGDPVRADDLVQETMLRAFRSWHRFRSGTNARAWLFTILRNAFVSDYRRNRRNNQAIDLSEVEEITVVEPGRDSDPEALLLEGHVDDEVLACIAALPDPYRETLVLSDVEGLSYIEVAEVLGVPLGTVKSRLFRARQTLQRQLHDYAVEMGYIKPREELRLAVGA